MFKVNINNNWLVFNKDVLIDIINEEGHSIFKKKVLIEKISINDKVSAIDFKNFFSIKDFIYSKNIKDIKELSHDDFIKDKKHILKKIENASVKQFYEPNKRDFYIKLCTCLYLLLKRDYSLKEQWRKEIWVRVLSIMSKANVSNSPARIQLSIQNVMYNDPLKIKPGRQGSDAEGFKKWVSKSLIQDFQNNSEEALKWLENIENDFDELIDDMLNKKSYIKYYKLSLSFRTRKENRINGVVDYYFDFDGNIINNIFWFNKNKVQKYRLIDEKNKRRFSKIQRNWLDTNFLKNENFAEEGIIYGELNLEMQKSFENYFNSQYCSFISKISMLMGTAHGSRIKKDSSSESFYVFTDWNQYAFNFTSLFKEESKINYKSLEAINNSEIIELKDIKEFLFLFDKYKNVAIEYNSFLKEEKNENELTQVSKIKSLREAKKEKWRSEFNRNVENMYINSAKKNFIKNDNFKITEKAHIIPFSYCFEINWYSAAVDPNNCLFLSPNIHRAYDNKLFIFDHENNYKIKLLKPIDYINEEWSLNESELSEQNKKYIKKYNELFVLKFEKY
ncbi:HNH endonuclease signature motif containing protein [Mesoplasma florum]|uniref:HNH endonuclease signature motif containing protein n=1 Tax=Mesoplasma florum TaxID=2151 RepID=UPI000BE43584|nr:HNH endonuclease signature motif containing protein [Mesoplasma florum]ATI73275.1 hypothetical protein CQZ69_01700 [Mesoplasma florum]AVN61677.1 hypothetical protein CG004_01700 [Mesoplasma florum]